MYLLLQISGIQIIFVKNNTNLIFVTFFITQIFYTLKYI